MPPSACENPSSSRWLRPSTLFQLQHGTLLEQHCLSHQSIAGWFWRGNLWSPHNMPSSSRPGPRFASQTGLLIYYRHRILYSRTRPSGELYPEGFLDSLCRPCSKSVGCVLRARNGTTGTLDYRGIDRWLLTFLVCGTWQDRLKAGCIELRCDQRHRGRWNSQLKERKVCWYGQISDVPISLTDVSGTDVELFVTPRGLDSADNVDFSSLLSSIAHAVGPMHKVAQKQADLSNIFELYDSEAKKPCTITCPNAATWLKEPVGFYRSCSLYVKVSTCLPPARLSDDSELPCKRESCSILELVSNPCDFRKHLAVARARIHLVHYPYWLRFARAGDFEMSHGLACEPATRGTLTATKHHKSRSRQKRDRRTNPVQCSYLCLTCFKGRGCLAVKNCNGS